MPDPTQHTKTLWSMHTM